MRPEGIKLSAAENEEICGLIWASRQTHSGWSGRLWSMWRNVSINRHKQSIPEVRAERRNLAVISRAGFYLKDLGSERVSVQQAAPNPERIQQVELVLNWSDGFWIQHSLRTATLRSWCVKICCFPASHSCKLKSGAAAESLNHCRHRHLSSLSAVRSALELTSQPAQRWRETKCELQTRDGHSTNFNDSFREDECFHRRDAVNGRHTSNSWTPPRPAVSGCSSFVFFWRGACKTNSPWWFLSFSLNSISLVILYFLFHWPYDVYSRNKVLVNQYFKCQAIF